MIVYHGSDHIIETPLYNGSKRTNDYGYGFYTTENKELAMESQSPYPYPSSYHSLRTVSCYTLSYPGRLYP